MSNIDKLIIKILLKICRFLCNYSEKFDDTTIFTIEKELEDEE